jgi:hypothetical protein
LVYFYFMPNVLMAAAVLVVANLLHRTQEVEISFKSPTEAQAGGLYLLGLIAISLLVVFALRSCFGHGGGDGGGHH